MNEPTNITQGPKSRIAQALDAMNPVELRAAAYHGLMAQCYSKASLTGHTNMQDRVDDHLEAVATYDMDQERHDFAESLMENGYPDDVAHSNYWRRLLGIAPLDTEGNEMAPGTYNGWGLADAHDKSTEEPTGLVHGPRLGPTL